MRPPQHHAQQELIARLARAASQGVARTRLPGCRKAESPALTALIGAGTVVRAKAGRGFRYYLAEEAPSAAAAGKLRGVFAGLPPFKLLTRTQLRALGGVEARALESGLRELLDSGEIFEFVWERGKLYGSAAALRAALAGGRPAASLDRSEAARIDETYRQLVAKQGGFRSVGVAALARHSGVAIGKVKAHVLDELRKGRAILHRLSDLAGPEEAAGAILLAGEAEPFHNVEFGNFHS